MSRANPAEECFTQKIIMKTIQWAACPGFWNAISRKTFPYAYSIRHSTRFLLPRLKNPCGMIFEVFIIHGAPLYNDGILSSR